MTITGRVQRGVVFFHLCLILKMLVVPPYFSAAATDCPPIEASLAQQRMSHLRKEILHHNHLYYESMRPEISDADYDRLFSELVLLEGCFPSLAAADSPTCKVAADPAGKKTLKHDHRMLSLYSSSGPEAVQSLLDRVNPRANSPSLLVQPKVDGLPVELIYLSGRLISAATRGDGEMGADVTDVAKRIPGIPLQLTGNYPGRLALRGEVYAERGLMAKAIRDGKRGKRYATPRHFAAATLKSRRPAPLALAALRLFPFELSDADKIAGVGSDLAALALAAGWGFPVALEQTREVHSREEIETIYQSFLAKRGTLAFAADGIVVKVNDLSLRRALGEGSRGPFWAAAWKFPPETAKTVVRGIRWQQGRTGRRTPVAEVEPVSLGGVTITRVSLQNARTVERLGIRGGDRVVVALAADVIPQVMSVEKGEEREAQRRTVAEAPAAGVAGCLTDAPGCREQFLARLAHFVSRQGVNVTGLGRGRLRTLVEAGLVTDLPSLFRLTAEELAPLPGFGPEPARRLVSALRQVAPPATFPLLTALGIPGVGPAAAKRVAKEHGSLAAVLAARPKPEDGTAVRKIREFFDSREGKELLKGLREARLL